MLRAQDERNFKKLLSDEIPDSILTTCIEWLRLHAVPDDVFDTNALETWAEDNGYENKSNT